MSWYGRLEGFELEGAVDLVSQADRESERLLCNAIRSAFPDDGILAEEGGGHDGGSEWTWVLDPLDGTTNFVHGFPFFLVSIGLLRGSERVAGVCYGPFHDELFRACRGDGAYLGDTPIGVSSTESLGRSLVATGFPYNRREVVDELLVLVKRGMCAAHGLRRTGSAAYDLCMLAAGRVDGFFEQGLCPWDIAAGTVIVEEAGGQVTMYDGSPFDLFGDTILASNGRIQDELRQTVIEGR